MRVERGKHEQTIFFLCSVTCLSLDFFSLFWCIFVFDFPLINRIGIALAGFLKKITVAGSVWGKCVQCHSVSLHILSPVSSELRPMLYVVFPTSFVFALRPTPLAFVTIVYRIISYLGIIIIIFILIIASHEYADDKDHHIIISSSIISFMHYLKSVLSCIRRIVSVALLSLPCVLTCSVWSMWLCCNRDLWGPPI